MAPHPTQTPDHLREALDEAVRLATAEEPDQQAAIEQLNELHWIDRASRVGLDVRVAFGGPAEDQQERLDAPMEEHGAAGGEPRENEIRRVRFEDNQRQHQGPGAGLVPVGGAAGRGGNPPATEFRERSEESTIDSAVEAPNTSEIKDVKSRRTKRVDSPTEIVEQSPDPAAERPLDIEVHNQKATAQQLGRLDGEVGAGEHLLLVQEVLLGVPGRGALRLDTGIGPVPLRTREPAYDPLNPPHHPLPQLPHQGGDIEEGGTVRVASSLKKTAQRVAPGEAGEAADVDNQEGRGQTGGRGRQGAKRGQGHQDEGDCKQWYGA